MEKKEPGSLSLVTFSSLEKKNFVKYMNVTKPDFYVEYLMSLFEDDFLEFFDVFSGVRLKVPTREEMSKIIMNIKIYSYCSSFGFTEDSLSSASKIFCCRLSTIRNIITKVQDVLDSSKE